MAVETCTWITAAGASIPLTDRTTGVWMPKGPASRFMPPVEIVTRDTPNNAGARIDNVTFKARQVTIDLLIDTAVQATTRTTLRTLLAAFDPTRGDGRLRFATVAGDTRELVCRYAGGLEGDDSNSDPGLTEIPLSLTFLATDPYWTDPTDTTNSWTVEDGQTFLPILPIRLSSSEVFASPTLTNTGDVETYPVWTILGPGSGLVLTHLATGRTLAWDGTLGDGETLTIDARPSSLTAAPYSVELQDGTSQFQYLRDGGHDFWPLSIGTQKVQIEMSGASALSTVSVTYRPRYLGA